jgi:hypothetical protein
VDFVYRNNSELFVARAAIAATLTYQRDFRTTDQCLSGPPDYDLFSIDKNQAEWNKRLVMNDLFDFSFLHARLQIICVVAESPLVDGWSIFPPIQYLVWTPFECHLRPGRWIVLVKQGSSHERAGDPRHQ